MVDKKIAVIGAGLGGLSAALRLASQGYKVDVYEQNDLPGGKANQILQEGFRFDTGPSLLTMPFVLKELFEYSGERIEDYLEVIPLNILCKYCYYDGTVINSYSDLDKFSSEIENKTSDKAVKVKEYLNYSKTIYDLTADLFLYGSFSDIKNFINLKSLKTLINIHKIDPFRTMHNANKSFFKDSKTIQLFDRYATYNGSNPYEVPATLNIIQHVEYNLGGYIIKDGIYSIAESLFKLNIKKGVDFYFNSSIEKILLDGKRVNGITINNKGKITNRDYDVVISNADVNLTYEKLLNDTKSKSALRYKKQTPSSSALVFYWGVEGNYNELEIHNILFSKNYKKEFDDLFVRKKYPDDPTVYIYISSKFRKDDAPDGYENWFVMINVPYLNGEENTNEIDKARKTIQEKINNILKIDLTGKIVFEKILSPSLIQKQTGSYKGSIYGISSNNRNAAFLRQKNRSKEYKGLYFCGGSAHPGGGIPLVLLSGKIASEEIMRYE